MLSVHRSVFSWQTSSMRAGIGFYRIKHNHTAFHCSCEYKLHQHVQLLTSTARVPQTKRAYIDPILRANQIFKNACANITQTMNVKISATRFPQLIQFDTLSITCVNNRISKEFAKIASDSTMHVQIKAPRIRQMQSPVQCMCRYNFHSYCYQDKSVLFRSHISKIKMDNKEGN